MVRLLVILFALPWWAFMPLSAGVGWLSVGAYNRALLAEAEQVEALTMAAPEAVDLGVYDPESDLHKADEVHVTGWIDFDLNYELIKKTNGVTTGRRYMMVLFGAEDAKGRSPARAAMVMTKAQKEAFLERIETYIVDERAQGLVFGFNGFAHRSDAYSTLAVDALRDEGVSRADDFFYLEPFFDGRAAALSPKGAPLSTLLFGMTIAVAVFLIGFAKKVLGGKPERRSADAIKDMAGEATPVATEPHSYDMDTPLGRIAAKQAANKAGQLDGMQQAPELNVSPDLSAPLLSMAPAIDRKADLSISRRVRRVHANPALDTEGQAEGLAHDGQAAGAREVGARRASTQVGREANRRFYVALGAGMALVGTMAYDPSLLVYALPVVIYGGLAVMVYRMGFKLRGRLRGLFGRPEVI